MAYTINRPTASEELQNSQPLIRDNFNQANTTYGTDHYSFTSGANNGYHNQVTTPIISGSAHPATTTNVLFYAMQDTANIGLLQYSKGTSDAAPTPLTNVQSPVVGFSLAAGATSNVIDFTGVQTAYGTIYVCNAGTVAGNFNGIGYAVFLFNVRGGAPNFDINYSGTVGFTVNNSGYILRVKNNSLSTNFTNVYWSVKFERIVI